MDQEGDPDKEQSPLLGGAIMRVSLLRRQTDQRRGSEDATPTMLPPRRGSADTTPANMSNRPPRRGSADITPANMSNRPPRRGSDDSRESVNRLAMLNSPTIQPPQHPRRPSKPPPLLEHLTSTRNELEESKNSNDAETSKGSDSVILQDLLSPQFPMSTLTKSSHTNNSVVFQETVSEIPVISLGPASENMYVISQLQPQEYRKEYQRMEKDHYLAPSPSTSRRSTLMRGSRLHSGVPQSDPEFINTPLFRPGKSPGRCFEFPGSKNPGNKKANTPKFRLSTVSRVSQLSGGLGKHRIPMLHLEDIDTSHRILYIVTLTLIVSLLFGTTTYFCLAQKWSIIDSVYFATITLSLVGYGDVVPLTDVDKIVVCCVALVGVAIIATCAGILMEYVIEREDEKRLEEELGGSEEDDASGELWQSIWKCYTSFASAIMIICIGAVPYKYLEAVAWVDAFYWATITVTTIGYGDQTPQTVNGKAFAMVYAFVGCLLLAKLLGNLFEIPLQLRRRQHATQVVNQFGDFLTEDHLEEILKKVESLGMTHGKDRAVSKAEFSIVMMWLLGKISEVDIRMSCNLFDKLDTTKDNQLTEADLGFGIDMLEAMNQSFALSTHETFMW